ncbi:MAG: arginase family protein [Bacteriovoracaceae bacterium]|nr:arginase family protein [Bacteriovoracaceae bacterium]
MIDRLINTMKDLLCPPGSGVFTVNTAKERKAELGKLLYPNSQNIQDSWEQSLEVLAQQKVTNLLGICSDCGGGILRGANWGPLFIRLKLLETLSINKEFFDLGDIRVIPHLLHDKYLNPETLKSCKNALYGSKESTHSVSPLSITEEFLDIFYETHPKKTIFALGGDHSVSYPLVKSYLKAKKKSGTKVGLIHFDAHTDLLVDRLGIDLCFGSWTTHILDGLDSPTLCYQIGIRSSGKPKEHWEKTFGLTQYWSSDVFKRGAMEIAHEIIDKLTVDKVEEIYISFDIDALDVKYASSTGTPEADGLEPHQAIIIIQELQNHFKLSGADMVEVAPFLRTDIEAVTEPETTLNSAAIISKILIKGLNRYGNL